MRSTSRFVGVSLLALAAAGACHRARMEGDSIPASVPRVSDGDIVAIILAANNTDLSYARLVPSRSNTASVKAFAQRMTTDHTLLNARVKEIAEKNGIVAEDNAISLDFRDNSAARRDILRELEGAKFDSTYAANEVQYHTELLAALEGVLIPQARTAELREFVTNLKPSVSAHLTHAQQMRDGLIKRK